MIRDKSIKYKVTLGYIILAATALFSIWYLLTEIKKINSPREELLRENNAIFEVGNVINNIYATESTGRIALITTSNKDIKKYHTQLDSVINQLNQFKLLIREDNINHKIESIQELISEKKKNFNEIIKLKKRYLNSDNFERAFVKFRNQKKKFDTYADVHIEPIKTEKKSLIQRIFNSTNEAEDKARLEKEIENRNQIEQKHQIKRDSLAYEAELIFNEAIQKDSKLKNQFYQKEERLMIENKYLTDEIKLLLTEVEQNVIKNSTEKIIQAKQILDNTTSDIIYFIGFALLLVLILGLVVINDLNKNYRYKKNLEVLNENMERLMNQKSMFFATVTHDIISPLNTLVGFTELLQQTPNSETQKKYIKNIIHSTNYIRNLSNDLVDFSKLEYNKIVLKREIFNFNELMQSIFEPLSDTANQKNIDLFYEIDQSLNDTFYSDPYRIKQILTNITTNAIKFTNKGSVKIHATEENSFIKITIIDTGIGIKKENQTEIFKEFKQAHEGIEKIYGGTGLGLNITKGLVDILDGKIEFESEIQKGTTFIVYLPKIRKNYTVTESADLTFDNDKKLINKHLLVIDDDSLQLQLITEILKEKVASVTTLIDGENIENLLNTNTYDLIITDIQMPKLNGFKIIEIIKSNKNHREIPVIAFTGKLDLDEISYLNKGFSSLVAKPIQINKLIFEIHRVLEINFLRDETFKSSSNYTNDKDFNLKEILIFTQNDQIATQKILNLFIENTIENIALLEKQAINFDLKEIENTAHKMLPMFKQLHVNSIIGKLLKLERDINDFDKETLINYISVLKIEIEKLVLKLKNIKM